MLGISVARPSVDAKDSAGFLMMMHFHEVQFYC